MKSTKRGSYKNQVNVLKTTKKYKKKVFLRIFIENALNIISWFNYKFSKNKQFVKKMLVQNLRPMSGIKTQPKKLKYHKSTQIVKVHI